MEKKLTDKQKGALEDAIKVLMTPEAALKINFNEETQQFLVRLLDLREDALHTDLCQALAEVIAAQNKKMFDTLATQTGLMEGVAGDISFVRADIKDIKTKMAIMEKKQLTDESRIEETVGKLVILEQKIELVQPDRVESLINELELFRPQFKKLITYSSWWVTVLRIIISMAVGISLVYYFHRMFWNP